MTQSNEDFLAQCLAAIEEQKAARADSDRLNQGIPLIVDCIKKMILAELLDEEVIDLFRHAADVLEKARNHNETTNT